jgi:16S rRNA (cytosine967-C5)-methyltransferase
VKFFKNLVEAVVKTLELVMLENRYSDKVLEKLFKANPQWGSRDRKFIAESVYDITRHYRYLSAIAGSDKNFRLIFAAYLHEKDQPLPDWPDYQSINTKLFDLKKKEISLPAVIHSYPDELWELIENELGEETWLKEAKALNEQANVVLRVNTLKTAKTELQKKLLEEGIETDVVNNYPDALFLRKRQNVFSVKAFKDGWFEVQDAGSQTIAPFLKPEQGQKIIDACAGGGGKSLHLSALMKNKGHIIAMDVEGWKLEELKKRAKRAGAHNIETRLIIDTTIKQMNNYADRLLLDVPCSGTGVIKRNPDAKWKLNGEVIERTKALQYSILKDYSTMLKAGGLMVYSTCSILPSENQKQVERFMNEHEGRFTLLSDKTIMPSEGFDGFYMALLRKEKAE